PRPHAGDGRGRTGSPLGAPGPGVDVPVLLPPPRRRPPPPRRQQIFPAHQSKPPPQRAPDCAMSQPCPDLAMAFAMERAGGQHGTDRRRQRIVGHRAGWSAPPRWRCVGPWWRLMTVNCGSGKPPDRQTAAKPYIRLAADRRNSPAHGRCPAKLARSRMEPRLKGLPRGKQMIDLESLKRCLRVSPTLYRNVYKLYRATPFGRTRAAQIHQEATELLHVRLESEARLIREYLNDDWNVRYGPFAGMKYAAMSSGSLLSPKVIGSYE